MLMAGRLWQQTMVALEGTSCCWAGVSLLCTWKDHKEFLAKGPHADSAAGEGSSSACAYALFPCLAGTSFTTLKSDPVYLADFTCSPSALYFKLFPIPFPPLQSLSVCLLQSKVKESRVSQAWEYIHFLFFYLAFFNACGSGWCPRWSSVPLHSVIWSRTLCFFLESVLRSEW